MRCPDCNAIIGESHVAITKHYMDKHPDRKAPVREAVSRRISDAEKYERDRKVEIAARHARGKSYQKTKGFARPVRSHRAPEEKTTLDGSANKRIEELAAEMRRKK